MKKNPIVIYKYRDWDNEYHRKMLLFNELYLASPNDFNDPFDCRINQNFCVLSEEAKRNYIVNLIDQHKDRLFHDGIALEDAYKHCYNRMKNIKQFQLESDEILFRHQDRSYGIFSCSTRWDSILMWTHYSNNHTGFCIGLSWQKMMESGIFGKGGYVNYEIDFPQIEPCVSKLDSYFMEKSFIETHKQKLKNGHMKKNIDS